MAKIQTAWIRNQMAAHKRSMSVPFRAQFAGAYAFDNRCAKAAEYAAWLCARDGIAVSPRRAHVNFDRAANGEIRARWVNFECGHTVELPHWDFVAIEPIEEFADDLAQMALAA